MKDADILSLQARARKLACVMGYPSEAEDFAQEAVINALNGRSSKLEHQLIDYLRVFYGSSQTLAGRLKQFETHVELSTDQMQPTASEAQPEAQGSDWRKRCAFTGKHAILAEMRYDREMNVDAIAEVYGVTQSAISQILAKVNKEIEAASILDECMDHYRNDKNYSKLVVDWITI